MVVWLQVLFWLLPWRIRRRLLARIFGYQIDMTAHIGCSIIFVDRLQMGPGSVIGHLTLVKNLRRLELGACARLGNLNWVTAVPAGTPRHFQEEIRRDPSLIVGQHAAITHRHLIDCTDSVIVDDFTTIAGWGSQILTHAIDLGASRQSCAPVRIGKHCFVGTRVVLLKGSSLPDRCVLSAGSVLAGAMAETDSLYSGLPASVIKKMPENAKYFVREIGFVE